MSLNIEQIKGIRLALPKIHVKELRVLCQDLLDEIERRERVGVDTLKESLLVEGDRAAREREEKEWS